MILLTNLIPVTSEFQLIRKERAFESEFTGEAQVLSDPVSYWRVELSFQNVPNKAAKKLIGTLASLRGATGQFKLFDWSNSVASGVGGAYVVDYFEQSLPGLIAIRHVPDGELVADIGDMVEINGELKLVLNEVRGGIDGIAWVEIEPWVRVPVSGGEAVNFDQPTGVFRLTPNFTIPRLTSKKLIHAEIDIEAVEVFSK